MTTIEKIKIRNQKTFSSSIEKQLKRIDQREFFHLMRKQTERPLTEWEHQRLNSLKDSFQSISNQNTFPSSQISADNFYKEPNQALLKLIQGF